MMCWLMGWKSVSCQHHEDYMYEVTFQIFLEMRPMLAPQMLQNILRTNWVTDQLSATDSVTPKSPPLKLSCGYIYKVHNSLQENPDHMWYVA